MINIGADSPAGGPVQWHHALAPALALDGDHAIIGTHEGAWQADQLAHP